MSRLRLWMWSATELARLGRPVVGFGFWGGLGDELLCTIPLAEWQRRGRRNVWVSTKNPELFEGLEAGAHVLGPDRRYPALCERLGRPFHFLSYSSYDPAPDREIPPPIHIAAQMCRTAGLTGTVTLRPRLRLRRDEIAWATDFAGCVAIQTSTLTAHVPMTTKQWRTDRFQALVDRFTPRLRFVQLGSPGDPPLTGVIDLRGRASVRQTAAVLHESRAFVGLVGFLMHLARAVECPAVIVYGGRETAAQSGYVCNINIENRPPCSPCWQRTRCDFGHTCMEAIPAEAVAHALETLLARPREDLPVEQVKI